jgi:hypothetical protein
MYIINMTHYLDETGNISKRMHREARELAGFFALVIDTTTLKLPTKLTSTDIRCFKKGCQGTTRVEILHSSDEIHWMCSKCPNEGRISGWQETKWDNNSERKL